MIYLVEYRTRKGTYRGAHGWLEEVATLNTIPESPKKRATSPPLPILEPECKERIWRLGMR